MPTVERFGNGTEGVQDPLYKPNSAQVKKFMRLGSPRWWQAQHGQALALSGMGYWEGRAAGIRLTPAQSYVPLAVPNAGLGGSMAVRAAGSIPAGVLLTPAGERLIPQEGNWTIWALGRPSTTSSGHVLGVVGANGGTIALAARSSDLCRIHTYDARNVQATPASTTEPTANIALWMMCWDQTARQFQLWINGVLEASSPSGINLAPHSGRISLLGGWDETLGAIGDGRSAEIYAWGFDAAIHYGLNSAMRAEVRATILDQYPAAPAIAA